MDELSEEVLMDGDDYHMRDDSTPNGFPDPLMFPGDDNRAELQTPEILDGEEEDEEEEEEEEEDPDDGSTALQIGRPGLLPTGCCYDDRMKLHVNADFSPNAHHPEDPRRIEEIIKAFKKNGLLYTGPEADVARVIREAPNKYMWRIAAREATASEICTTHQSTHYEWVKALSVKGYAELRTLTKTLDSGRDSLYVGSMTFPAALLSAGGAIDTCRNVMAGNVKNAFAIIRPPGHHAEYDQPMGFCFFNNVPIAVRVCQQEYDSCKKVMILDWDVHHGNGIQNIFYDDPNVLYISIHVYEDGHFYPGKPENPMIPDGGIENCGADLGVGKNINIGWHAQGMGDGEYMAAFQKIVMPIAKEFNPDMVVISAGFDAADGDELGGCFVTPACYAHMTHMLMSLAGGKLAVCLEGGYNLKAISDSAVAVAKTLLGDPPPKMEVPKINKEAARLLAKVQAHQAPYWECMRPGIVDVPNMQNLNSARLHDVVRSAQRQVVNEKHEMIPLFIHRETLFKSFENQVLVTPDVQNARRLLVIIHDPYVETQSPSLSYGSNLDRPQLLAQPDVIESTLDSHNAWVVSLAWGTEFIRD
jgi:histone deacetylase 6